jgi:hypothetical protein
MEADLRRVVEDYLQRLRRSMRGASADVQAEALDEIRAHIEDALAAQPQAELGDVLDVLERLGRPEHYGRDMALYMMVGRGYRDWSLPHMLRSTAFWASRTLAGAVVVPIFGLLFAAAIGATVSGAWGLAGGEMILPGGFPVPMGDWWRPSADRYRSALVLMLAGLIFLGLLVAAVRWFVGQYVRHALPPGGDEGQAAAPWARRTERRILILSALGFGTNLLAGFASGAYALRVVPGPAIMPVLPPDFGRSPLAMLAGLGLVVLALSPVLGVLWSALVEAGSDDR